MSGTKIIAYFLSAYDNPIDKKGLWFFAQDSYTTFVQKCLGSESGNTRKSIAQQALPVIYHNSLDLFCINQPPPFFPPSRGLLLRLKFFLYYNQVLQAKQHLLKTLN